MMSTCQRCGKHYRCKPSDFEETKYCSRKCQLEFYCNNKKNIDLIGQSFNKLKVISFNGRNKRKNLIWNCICECGNTTTAITSELKSGEKKSCGCLLSPSYSQALNRIKEKITQNSIVNPNGCIEWQGKLNKKGYGRISFKERRLPIHRASWIVHKGEIPNDLWVLHHCDNPKCVNIDHLYLGTPKDNVRDMDERNRRKAVPGLKGSECILAKLKEEDIPKIKKMRKQGMSHREIGEIFNVTKGCIGHVLSGLNWKHIT